MLSLEMNSRTTTAFKMVYDTYHSVCNIFKNHFLNPWRTESLVAATGHLFFWLVTPFHSIS